MWICFAHSEYGICWSYKSATSLERSTSKYKMYTFFYIRIITNYPLTIMINSNEWNNDMQISTGQLLFDREKCLMMAWHFERNLVTRSLALNRYNLRATPLPEFNSMTTLLGCNYPDLVGVALLYFSAYWVVLKYFQSPLTTLFGKYHGMSTIWPSVLQDSQLEFLAVPHSCLPSVFLL